MEYWIKALKVLSILAIQATASEGDASITLFMYLFSFLFYLGIYWVFSKQYDCWKDNLCH